MAPPRDRLQNLQAQAYFEDDDQYNIPIDEDDHGPMQKFFREIEDLREVVNQIEKVTWKNLIFWALSKPG